MTTIKNYTENSRVETAAEKSFVCSFCGKGFAKSDKLKRHKRIHTGEKPYVCNFCAKAFTRSEHLRRHERIHTGEKPSACSYCGLAFARSEHLKRHEKSHTNLNSFANATTSLAASVERIRQQSSALKGLSMVSTTPLNYNQPNDHDDDVDDDVY